MRVFIDIKNEKIIRQIANSIDRYPQYVVNVILDYYLSSENPEQKIKEILTNNIKKIILDNKY